jgi:hypothetical protein
VREFDCVSWASCTSNGSTETQDEATTDELTHSVGSSLDGSADKNKRTTDEDANTTTVAISQKTAAKMIC